VGPIEIERGETSDWLGGNNNSLFRSQHCFFKMSSKNCGSGVKTRNYSSETE